MQIATTDANFSFNSFVQIILATVILGSSVHGGWRRGEHKNSVNEQS